MSEKSNATVSTEGIGAKLLAEIRGKTPKDSYRPNKLPPIDETRHTPEVIAALQKRAMQVD